MDQGPEGDTTGVLPGRDCHECGPRTGEQLGDNYDVLVKLLSDRFDPASRVSAFRSRFHGRYRRHHEDADAFADALAELCWVGYLQGPPELRQELIAEQFVRGQSDPELNKYIWVVIRTQKDRKLQTLIEVCTDFSSLTAPAHIHRLAEQTFAVHQQMEASCAEEDCESEAMFAVGDRTYLAADVRTSPPDGIRDAPYCQILRIGQTVSGGTTLNASSGMDRPRPVTRSSGRSVDWAVAVDDQLMDEAVLQISGAGHWFLEGWIGDDSVDFLVDLGSAVTVQIHWARFYHTPWT